MRATVVALLLLLLALPAAASEDLVPAEIGGVPAEVVSIGGVELLASLDPDDDAGAERAAALKTLLAVVGQPAESLSVAAAYPSEGTAGGWVAAIRVAGTDGTVLRALVLSGIRDDLGTLIQEDATVGDKAVTRLDVDGAGGSSPLVLYAGGDAVWLLGGTEPEVAALLEGLP